SASLRVLRRVSGRIAESAIRTPSLIQCRPAIRPANYSVLAAKTGFSKGIENVKPTLSQPTIRNLSFQLEGHKEVASGSTGPKYEGFSDEYEGREATNLDAWITSAQLQDA